MRDVVRRLIEASLIAVCSAVGGTAGQVLAARIGMTPVPVQPAPPEQETARRRSPARRKRRTAR